MANNSNILRGILVAIYFGFLVFNGFNALKHPLYNGDILSYAALILKLDNADTANVYEKKFQILKKEIPAERYGQLIAKAHNKSLLNKGKHNDHLPFYVVKPLYILCCFLFYKVSIPLGMSTVLPSVLAYIAVGILMFRWLKVYFSTVVTVCLCMMLMSWSVFLNMAKLSTPDAMSAFFVFAAMYYIIEKKHLTIGYLMLVLAIFTRLDNILLATAIMVMLFFLQREQFKTGKLLLALAGIAISFFVIAFMAWTQGWDLMFITSYFKRMNLSGQATEQFNFEEYFHMLSLGVIYALNKSHIAKMIVLMLAYLLLIKGKWEIGKWVVFTLLVVIVARFFLHPLTVDRFYFGHYLVFIVLFLIGFRQFVNPVPAHVNTNE